WSMLGQNHLHLLNRALHDGRGRQHEMPYAGVHVMFFGDGFQFEPIGDVALFKDPSVENNGKMSERHEGNALGFTLWRQMSKIVRLRHQYRVEDQLLGGILFHLRYGTGTPEDVKQLNAHVTTRNSDLS